ncbi:MAG: hypothetical protein AAF490_08770 [Chloroflexota bacterium]
MKSYILRLYGTPDDDNWTWRLVLTSLHQNETEEYGFQSLEALSEFLTVEIQSVEKDNEIF